MQQIILLSAKEIQRVIQRNYQYQIKGQHSWLKLLNDSIYVGTLIQRLSRREVIISTAKMFSDYFNIFSHRKTFIPSMAPFRPRYFDLD